MARDAQRLAAGEMDAGAFYDAYHEAVADTFGTDDRPVSQGRASGAGPGGSEEHGVAGPAAAESKPGAETEEAGDGSAPKPGVPAVGGDPSRRQLLGAVGGLIGAGTLAAGASKGVRGYASDSGDEAPDGSGAAGAGPPNERQLGMVIDTERCVACLKCSLACKQENDTDRGMHWVYVFRYAEERFGEVDREWLTRPCQHCSDPSCTYVCPTQARHKRWDGDGLVLTDYDLCVGCKYCMVACPYGVNFLGEDEPTELSPGFEYDTHGKDDRWVAGPPPEGVMGKCTFCVHRQDSGDPDLEGTTACEDICPADAIHFGDLTDPASDPRRHLRRKPGAHRFELLDEVGNEPNVIYIGKEPSKDAEPIPGPTTYEDRGMEVLGDFGYGEEEHP